MKSNIITDEEMIERARRADADYVAGRVLTIEELEKEIEKW